MFGTTSMIVHACKPYRVCLPRRLACRRYSTNLFSLGATESMRRAGSTLERPACIFSPLGRLLAVATADGRLKTFETGTGRLLKEYSGGKGTTNTPGHLEEPFTCLTWAPLPSQQDSDAEDLSMLVVGAVGGTVVAFNVLTGEQIWQQPGAHSGAVTSVAYFQGMIYSIGADDKIVSLELSSGNVVDTFEGDDISHAILISPANGGENLLLAGSEMYLYESLLKRRLRRFSGHTMDVNLLASAQGGTFAVSAAPSDRHLAIWNLGGQRPKKRKAQQAAAASLAMEQQAVSIAASSGEEFGGEESAFLVAAAEQSGDTLVWECQPQTDGSVATEIRAHLTAPSTGRNEPALALRLEETASGTALLLARGPAAKPTFQRVDIPASGKLEMELSPIQDDLVSASNGRKKDALGEVQHVVAISPEAIATVGSREASKLPEEEDHGVRKRRAADALDESELPDALDSDDEDSQDYDEDADEEDAAEDEGPTLADRVRALQMLGAATTSEVQPAVGAGQEESLSVLLSQGLHSQDEGLLERCFAVVNERVVSRTVAQIPAADAVELLTSAVQRLRANANRGQQLTIWIRAILLKHAATLMASPRAEPVLTALHQTIEARQALLQPMTALAGRLDMLLAQMPDEDGSMPDTSLGNGNVVFIADDDDDACVADALDADLSDSVWETDDEDDLQQDVDSYEDD